MTCKLERNQNLPRSVLTRFFQLVKRDYSLADYVYVYKTRWKREFSVKKKEKNLDTIYAPLNTSFRRKRPSGSFYTRPGVNLFIRGGCVRIYPRAGYRHTSCKTLNSWCISIVEWFRINTSFSFHWILVSSLSWFFFFFFFFSFFFFFFKRNINSSNLSCVCYEEWNTMDVRM